VRILKLAEYDRLEQAVFDAGCRADAVFNTHGSFYNEEDGSDMECYEQAFCELEDEAEALKDEAETLLKVIREIKEAANS